MHRQSRKIRRRGGDVEQYLVDAKANLKPTATKCATRDAFNRCVAGKRKTRRRKVRRGGATKSEALDEIERIIQTPMLIENLKKSDELSKNDPAAYFADIERYKEQIRAFAALEKVTTQNGPFIERDLAPLYPDVKANFEDIELAAEIFQEHREGDDDPPVFAGSFLRLISAVRVAITKERAKLT